MCFATQIIMIKRLNKLLLNKKIFIILSIILLVVILFNIKKIQNIILKIIFPIKYEQYVEKYSKEYNVEENLIFAIIKAESNFNKDISSNKEAKGLMQILYSTAEEVAESVNLQISKQDLYNEEVNINIGTKYIAKLIQKYDNVELALAAYNAGTGNVDKWIEQGILKKDGSNIEQIPFKETNNYVRKVIRNYRIYNDIY